MKTLTRPAVLGGHQLPGVRVGNLDKKLEQSDMPGARRIDIPLDPGERIAFVRRWIKNNQRAIKRGGVGSTLVMPLLAQSALANELKVSANDVIGVSEVVRQSNGGVTLEMQSGTAVEIAPRHVALEEGDVVVELDALLEALGQSRVLQTSLVSLPDVASWQALPSGAVEVTREDGARLLLSSSDVDVTGDVAWIGADDALRYGIASSEDVSSLLVGQVVSSGAVSTGGSVSSDTRSSASADTDGGGISPWVYVGGGTLALGAGAAAGGGGGGSGSTEVTPSTISGFVIDGYIAGAKVTRQFDGNEVITNEDGFFEGLQGSGYIQVDPVAAADGMQGSVDIATNQPFNLTLRAPEGFSVVTPLTTLMVASNSTNAESVVLRALGLQDQDAPIDLRNTDPLAEGSANLELLVAGIKVASVLSAAQAAGKSPDATLSNLYQMMVEAVNNGSTLSNAQMASAIGSPGAELPVVSVLDDLDTAADTPDENLLDTYREGNANPLSEAQIKAQGADSSILPEVSERAELVDYTLEEALALSSPPASGEYVILPSESPLNAGVLGLTRAGEQLQQVNSLLDNAAYSVQSGSERIPTSAEYRWSVESTADLILAADTLSRPEIQGADSVTLRDATITIGQYRELDTLAEFDLGDTVVPMTMMRALMDNLDNDLSLPANYTIDLDAVYAEQDVSLERGAALIDTAARILDNAQNSPERDDAWRELLDWSIKDTLDNILAVSPERPELALADSFQVEESELTPAQFVELSSLGPFELADTLVVYTLQQALDAEPIASNYRLEAEPTIDAGTLTVDQAETEYALVNPFIQGASNRDALPDDLFTWSIQDAASAVVADIGQAHISQAQSIQVTSTYVPVREYEQLIELANFASEGVIPQYTLEQAFAEELSPDGSYAIDPDALWAPPGALSVNQAQASYTQALALIENADNTAELDIGEIFIWRIEDMAAAITAEATIGQPYIQNADQVSVTNARISLRENELLQGLDNYVAGDEIISYTMQEALSAVDADTLPASYELDIRQPLGEVEVARAQTALEILDNAENTVALDALEWQVLDGLANVLPTLESADNRAITAADQVTLTDDIINYLDYQQLIDALGRAEDGGRFVLDDTLVRYTLQQAVESGGTVDAYEIVPDEAYTLNGLSINETRETLAQVESILEGALAPEDANVDELFSWSVNDSAEAILAAGDITPLTRADVINVTDEQITLEQFTALNTLDNYVRDGEAVAYTLDQAFSTTDGFDPASLGNLLDNYAITADSSLTEIISVEQASTLVNVVVEEAANDPLATLNWQLDDSTPVLLDNLATPEVAQAQTVTISDEVIEYDDYQTLLDALGSAEDAGSLSLAGTRVLYTLQQAVENDGPVEAYEIVPEATYPRNDLSVTEASDTLTRVESILDGAFAPDDADADVLFNWTVRDSAEAILAAGGVDHLTRADTLNVIDSQVTLDQFTALDALDNYERGTEAVAYTLDEAFSATNEFDPASVDALLNNYAITPESELTNVITVAQATTLVNVVDAAANDPLANLVWQLDDNVQALLDNLATPAVTQAQTVTLTDDIISYNDYLTLLADLGSAADDTGSLSLEGTRVLYTLQQAVESDELVGAYEIAPDEPYTPSGLNVTSARDTLARVESILEGALASSSINVDELFNWTVRDSAEAILAAGNVDYLTRADAINVANNQITLDQFTELSALDNYARDTEAVAYTLDEAFTTTDGFDPASSGNLLDNYAITSGSILSNTITVAQASGMLSVVDDAANNPLDTLEWNLDDSADTLVDNLTSREVAQAQTVLISQSVINYSDYHTLLSELGSVENTGSLLLSDQTRVSYTLAQAVESGEPFERYEIVPGEAYTPDELSVTEASDTLARVESILEGALAPSNPNVDELFDWTVLDSAEVILAAGEVGHLTRSEALNITDDQITLDQFTELEALDNYVRSGETVEYSLDGNPAAGSAPESFTDFTTGAPPEGTDQLLVDLAETELTQLRGYDNPDWENANFAQYTDESEALGADVAFAVFTTAEFTGADTGWLNDLGLEDGEVAYLLAGNGETLTIGDDAQLYRVEGVADTSPEAQLLANFENVTLDNFNEENWLTSYDNQSGS
ncbi:hypothetical protein OR573_11595 [Halomonas sp. CH40]